MRGCDKVCSYCIVPFTRGHEDERRPIYSPENEVRQLIEQGIKEITLLGQNVNSYRDLKNNRQLLVVFVVRVYKSKIGGARFAELLECVAQLAPQTRIRFTSPHPKDFPDEVLHIIAAYPNICNSIYLTAQSGNTAVLERMSREAYLALVTRVR